LVSLPINAVLAVYAKENGRGMMFNEEDDSGPGPEGPEGPEDKPSRPSLKVVK